MKNIALYGVLAALLALCGSTLVHAFVATGTAEFHAELSGAKENPAVTTSAAGSMEVVFQTNDRSSEVTYSLSVETDEAVTAAHLHCAATGANGPPVVLLYSTTSPESSHGLLAKGTISDDDLITASCPVSITTTDELMSAIQNKQIYVNVHSTAHSDGLIRSDFTQLQFMGNGPGDEVWSAPTCGLLDKGDTVPTGYGAAYTFFTSARENVVKVVCGENGRIDLLVGSSTAAQTEYVFEDAYVYDGIEWIPFTLEGERVTTLDANDDPQDTVWFKERARGHVTVSPSPNPQYAVGYMCTYDSKWKCGCRTSSCTDAFWQLQPFISNE